MKSLNKQSLDKKEYWNGKSLHNHECSYYFIQDNNFYPYFLVD